MSDYINREDVKTAIREHFNNLADRVEINTIINVMPTIDIVRCKECRHWDTDWIPSGGDDDVHWCSWKDLVEYGDWFCADGERKEGE